MERSVEASATMHASTSSALSILRSSPELVLGDAESETGVGRRMFRTTVAAQLRAGTNVEQAVIITVGPFRTTGSGDDATASFGWEPFGLERFLPSFTGELTVARGDGGGSRLAVHGSYRAPLGPVGRFGDSVVGHRIARQSLAHHVEGLAGRIDREVIRRSTTASVRPAPYNEDLRPHSRSTHHRD